MDHGAEDVKKMRAIYQARRDALLPGLDSLEIEYLKPKASFYVWARTPGGLSSEEWVGRLINEAGIMCSPGNGYGQEGEGFFRMALIVTEERIREAVERMRKIRV
jgi:LL-diaminopimelate aminotransferase